MSQRFHWLSAPLSVWKVGEDEREADSEGWREVRGELGDRAEESVCNLDRVL